VISSFRSLWIVTNDSGRWAVAARVGLRGLICRSDIEGPAPPSSTQPERGREFLLRVQPDKS